MASPFAPVVGELREIAAKIEQAVQPLRTGEMSDLRMRAGLAVADVGHAWSGSWLGYHARVYLNGFEPAKGSDFFDAEWGARDMGMISSTRGDWAIYTYQEVRDEITRRAVPFDHEELVRISVGVYGDLVPMREDLLAILDAYLFSQPDTTLQGLRETLGKTPLRKTADDEIHEQMPRQFISRDSAAVTEGLKVPPHMEVGAWIETQFSPLDNSGQFQRLALRAAKYLELKHLLGVAVEEVKPRRVLIGHGRAAQWRDLKDLLQDRLKIPYEEFNREPAAGISTTDRLNAMLGNCSFAFLVLTAEDEQADGTMRARENVIHEVGLCQSRYGAHRAIVLLEEGCAEFSNIQGLGQIRFPKGKILAESEEIRRVLEREGLLDRGS